MSEQSQVVRAGVAQAADASIQADRAVSNRSLAGNVRKSVVQRTVVTAAVCCQPKRAAPEDVVAVEVLHGPFGLYSEVGRRAGEFDRQGDGAAPSFVLAIGELGRLAELRPVPR